ncbi:hypothetical protein LCGC14_0394200 [marine sediment metagenome]|uniref:Uncharacterized protein n=1 Tax=marine sediment metagenome TaxID=412755 RepID=A0A0F9SYR8_9ZZZZ
MDPDLRDKIIKTATKVEGIEADVGEIKEGQGKIWTAIDGLREDGQETRVALGKINWLPKVVYGLLMAIIGRALWIIGAAGKP